MGPDFLVDIETNVDDIIKIFEILIKHGYDLNKRRPNQHSLLYNFSVGSIHPNPKIIRFLVKNGAKMNPECETKDDFRKISRREKYKKIILDNIDFDKL
ncbi:hypothetical protein M9Y10_008836 [Tritrichomonas musculus]|uniref:Ankyrin repeat protein n=1 Tax=Tritrichomonas musculus TaxID=1915356 RepID=A0ABR2J0B8_9EUKA